MTSKARASHEHNALAPGGDSRWLMLLVSIASLYIELLLIRWVGTEVRLFAFVQNLVLITCFLGFGVGCFQSGKPGSLLPSLYVLAGLSFIICLPLPAWQEFLLQLSNLLTMSSDDNLWGDAGGQPLPAWMRVVAVAMVAGMLGLVAFSMIPLGRWIGYCFDHSKNTISTYTVNLAGSLAGTWLLVIFAVLHMPPVVWIGAAFVLVLLCTPKSRATWLTGGLLLLPVLLMLELPTAGDTYWSPYQKLTVLKADDEGQYVVQANNVGYMSIANLTPGYLKKHPDIAAKYKDSSYDSPFRFAPPKPSVLIVGAGAGNDAAAALRNGASHVDAVEIDPVIYETGKRLHPEHPYDSPKVNVIVNDARNFLRSTDNRYDMIVFGLLDSLTNTSGYTNMRVDNYVYTEESFAQARKLLKPNGILVLKFEVRGPWGWIGQRFYRTLTEVFGREPVTYARKSVGHIFPATIFIESNDKALWKRAQQPDLKKLVDSVRPRFPLSLAEAPPPTTDDWPYAYHRYHSIPATYLTVAAILLALAYVMVRKVFVVRERQTWNMFLLGAGFLLMETQLVSRLLLYFGNTWIVNSVAVSVVLAVLVLANLAVEAGGGRDRRPLCYGLLVASLLLNYLFLWEQLSYSPWTTGVLLSCAYAFSVLMAGIIFTTTLQQARKKSGALGANVMGAVVGGLSQNLSFIIGLKALLPVAAACYAGSAFLALRRKK